jgi:hypothetical protein
MGLQSAAADRDIEQRAFYTAFSRRLFKGKRNTVVVGIGVLAQPRANVPQNCCLIPTLITKSAIAPCCDHPD